MCLRPWWSKDTIAVVTGANKGVGYEIVHGLAKEGLTVVLTARDQSRGQSAVEALKAEGLESIWFHQLDVGSPEAVQILASWLKSKFGGIDILVLQNFVGAPMVTMAMASLSSTTDKLPSKK